MPGVKSLLLILLLSFNFIVAFSQLEWSEISVSQLPELNSMHLTCMDADEEGVWIGTEAGLMYWRAETQEFERISTFVDVPIKEVIYSKNWVFVLTKSGSVSRLEYNGITANVFKLSPDGVGAVDISVDGTTVAAATRYDGVYVYTNALINHYEPGSSFVGSTILNCVSWYNGLLFVGNATELRCSNGEVYTDSTGLAGSQVYKMDNYLNYLYIATNRGVSTYNMLTGFGQTSGGQINNSIVLNFSFDLPSPYIATSYGLLIPNTDFGNNTWVTVPTTAQSNSNIVDALEYNGKTFYAFRNEGLIVEENGDSTSYQYTEGYFGLNEIFEWNNQLYGVANQTWLFQFDTVLNRLKLVEDFHDYGKIYSTLASEEGSAYLFFNRSVYDLVEKRWYYFYEPYYAWNGLDQTPVFHPETGAPCLIWHNNSVFCLSDEYFKKIIAGVFVQSCNHRFVKQADPGVVFYCENEISVWNEGGSTHTPIDLIYPDGYSRYTYLEVFFNGNSPLFIDSDSMYYEHMGHQSILADHEDYMNPKYVEFISNDRAIAYSNLTNDLNVYHLTGFSRAANFKIPFNPSNERFTFMDKEERLWIANEEKIIWTSIPNTPKPANEAPIRAFPNPNYGVFNVELSLNQVEHAVMTISNIAGTIVDSREVDLQSALENVQYDLPNLSNGVYILNLTGQSVEAQSRIVVLNN